MMKFASNNISKTTTLQKIILLLCGLMFLTTSCDFVGKELKQDQRLYYYRYHARLIPDSINQLDDRVEAYKKLIAEASEDKYLITDRKKNKLLSEILIAAGNEYYAKGDFQSAIESITLGISFDKLNQHAYYNRACIYQGLGEDSLAIADYSKAILYDENYADAYYNRALIYQKRADFQLAVEDYSKALAQNHSYVSDIYNNRGNIYQQMNFYDKAIEDYNMAIEKDSTMSIAYYNRADVLIHLGKFDEALSDYKRADLSDSAMNVVIGRINKMREELRQQKLVAGKNQ